MQSAVDPGGLWSSFLVPPGAPDGVASFVARWFSHARHHDASLGMLCTSTFPFTDVPLFWVCLGDGFAPSGPLHGISCVGSGGAGGRVDIRLQQERSRPPPFPQSPRDKTHVGEGTWLGGSGPGTRPSYRGMPHAPALRAGGGPISFSPPVIPFVIGGPVLGFRGEARQFSFTLL